MRGISERAGTASSGRQLVFAPLVRKAGDDTTSGGMGAFATLLFTASTSALHLGPSAARPAPAPAGVGEAALVSLCCSAALLLSGPAHAAVSMESALAEAADASYPVLRAATPSSVSKLAGLARQASPAELAKAIDLVCHTGLEPQTSRPQTSRP